MAARSLFFFGPTDALPNSGTAPDPGVDGQYRPYLSMTTGETFDLPAFIAPSGVTAPLTLIATYRMESATANAVALSCAVESISDGDTTDTDAASSFDTANQSSDTTVPGTAGYIDQLSLTLSNNDGIAAGDMVRLRISRATPAGTDASGALQLLALELRDDGG